MRGHNPPDHHRSLHYKGGELSRFEVYKFRGVGQRQRQQTNNAHPSPPHCSATTPSLKNLWHARSVHKHSCLEGRNVDGASLRSRYGTMGWSSNCTAMTACLSASDVIFWINKTTFTIVSMSITLPSTSNQLLFNPKS